jgi:hypothetical protein
MTPILGSRAGRSSRDRRSPGWGLLSGAVLISLLGSGCGPAGEAPAEAQAESEPEWTPLFNGTDLEGWVPKIRGTTAGEDPDRTFRVEDGLLTVGYDGYEAFDDRFGLLFHEAPSSHYRLLVEYRFVGDQAPGGAGWALRNSGVMIHSQAPETMGVDQDFPISIEVQFLGGNGTDARPTGNLCTPGTHVHMDGALVQQHCIESTSATYHGEEWVTVEVDVRGDESITHIVNGDTVLAYGGTVIGGGMVSGFDAEAKPDGAALASGYIALQSESHPIQFRRVWLQQIEPAG